MIVWVFKCYYIYMIRLQLSLVRVISSCWLVSDRYKIAFWDGYVIIKINRSRIWNDWQFFIWSSSDEDWYCILLSCQRWSLVKEKQKIYKENKVKKINTYTSEINKIMKTRVFVIVYAYYIPAVYDSLIILCVCVFECLKIFWNNWCRSTNKIVKKPVPVD